MFPAVKLTITGLDPSQDYLVLLDVVPADNYRYKYHESEWLVTGKAYPDVPRSKRLYSHPESPGNGAKWMAAVVSFHKLKLTNNTSQESAGHVSASFYLVKKLIEINGLGIFESVSCICRDTGMCYYFGYLFGLFPDFWVSLWAIPRFLGIIVLVKFDFFRYNSELWVLILIFY